MKLNTKALPFALAIAGQTSARSFLRLTLLHTNQARALTPSASDSLSFQRTSPAGSALRAAGPLIYAVDDVPFLTELYTRLLATAGYVVRTFNERGKALAALERDRTRPALLITDYLGLSMPVNHFMQACRSVHPRLRILMASGFNQSEMQFSRVRPDRFIQKPFTAEEFQQAVKAALDDGT
jgi:CheY-like chemotaxis protein